MPDGGLELKADFGGVIAEFDPLSDGCGPGSVAGPVSTLRPL